MIYYATYVFDQEIVLNKEALSYIQSNWTNNLKIAYPNVTWAMIIEASKPYEIKLSLDGSEQEAKLCAELAKQIAQDIALHYFSINLTSWTWQITIDQKVINGLAKLLLPVLVVIVIVIGVGLWLRGRGKK